jgi:hypothetical protein
MVKKKQVSKKKIQKQQLAVVEEEPILGGRLEEL